MRGTLFFAFYVNLVLNCMRSPGRFFAANEIKSMLAYIIMRYDVKFAEEGVRPPNHDVFLNTFPSPGVEVLFRDRRDI